MIVLAAGSGNGGSNAGFFITLGLMLGAMYLLLFRPQRARMRAVAAAQASLAAGRQVVLTSGIFGTVVSVDTETVALEVSPGVHLKVARGAVARVTDIAEADSIDEAPAT
jgi:preprotein translocase subunit YajC